MLAHSMTCCGGALTSCACAPGGKYEVLLVVDPDADAGEDMPRREGGPRIAFQIMPAAAVQPGPSPRWQALAAGGLFLFTAATCLQLGLVANVSRLPKVRDVLAPWIDRPHAYTTS
jgi:hypothetical protein